MAELQPFQMGELMMRLHALGELQIVFGAMKKNAISFLEGHREQLGLSQQALDTFEGM